jgi:hypothetical protein
MHNQSKLDQSIEEIDWTEFDPLWEDFVAIKIAAMRPGNLTRQAKLYMGIENIRVMDRKTNRVLVAKRKKIRKSSRKSQRAKTHALTKEINWFLESNKKR